MRDTCTLLGNTNECTQRVLERVQRVRARVACTRSSLRTSARTSATSSSTSEQTSDGVTPSSNERVQRVRCYWKHPALLPGSCVRNAPVAVHRTFYEIRSGRNCNFCFTLYITAGSALVLVLVLRSLLKR
jgi:hypothetical protein